MSSLSHNNPPASDTSSQSPITHIFPPQMDAGIEWKFTASYFLGTEQNKKQFAVTFPKGTFRNRNKPLIVLHSGPTENNTDLAWVDYEPGHKKNQIIHVPPRPGSNEKQATQCLFTPYAGSWMKVIHRFSMEVGQDGRTEHFEWRMTTGHLIRTIGSYGFKLMRVADGQEEIVALLVVGNITQISKRYTFAFVGEGLTDMFGETWEIVAVASAIRTYQLEEQRIAASTAS
ncbi:hypothetical protein G7046_g5259 [Stylonectria norvegica]|nr:hypothetical protein G7046_g5259 [Stylonectria norvegica]